MFRWSLQRCKEVFLKPLWSWPFFLQNLGMTGLFSLSDSHSAIFPHRMKAREMGHLHYYVCGWISAPRILFNLFFKMCCTAARSARGSAEPARGPGAAGAERQAARGTVGGSMDAARRLGTGCRPASVPGGVDVPVAAPGSPELHGARFRVSLVGLCPPGVSGAPTPPGEQCTVRMSLGGAAQLSAAGLL